MWKECGWWRKFYLNDFFGRLTKGKSFSLPVIQANSQDANEIKFELADGRRLFYPHGIKGIFTGSFQRRKICNSQTA
jgi:hypothetical protein